MAVVISLVVLPRAMSAVVTDVPGARSVTVGVVTQIPVASVSVDVAVLMPRSGRSNRTPSPGSAPPMRPELYAVCAPVDDDAVSTRPRTLPSAGSRA